MFFSAGDLVRTKDGVGTIVDRLYSEIDEKYYFRVRIEGESKISSALYLEDDVMPYKDESEEQYIVETEILKNVVVVKVFKGEKEVVRGHGHIIHEGDVGIVQALSYALKKAYEKINGGNL